MLARFATGASFSAESRGGGRESNSRFLPFMIQMACHLLDQGISSQRRSMAKSVSAYISSESRPPTPGAPPGAEETVQFMMVNSLLSEPYPSWLNHRRAFLQRGIFHAHMQQHAHTSKTEPEPDLLPVVRPMLVYTGLVERLQRFFKVKVKVNASSSEEWEAAMKERVVNVKEMAGLSKDLVTWLDDMASASDLQEALDVAGLLADALAGGVASCEEFVRSAIGAGKS